MNSLKNRPMRVLHIYKDYAPILGGIENHIALLAQAQRAQGIDARVLVTNTGSKTVEEIINGVPVVKTGRQLNISSAPISIGFYPWLRRLEKEIDITHAHLPYPPGELAHLLLGRSRALVLSYHSDIVRQKILGALYSPFLRILLRQADRISVASPAYIRTSPFLAPVASKCQVLPFGIDLNAFATTPEIRQAAAELRARHAPKPLLLYVGKLRHYKGLNVLIDAMQQIDAHLLVVGSGMLEKEWRAQVTGLGLDDRISFLGELSDAEKLIALHASDLFILPSNNRAEAFGIVLIEAMACGLPLISTELGTGTSYVNQHEQTGMVVPPNDPQSMAAAINRLLGDDALRKQMGAAALARVRAEFSQEIMAARMLDLYEDVLARKSPSPNTSARNSTP
jgi:glycosyltransferase involved in cell wall biosynthesis